MVACSREWESPCSRSNRSALNSKHSDHRRYHGFTMSTLDEEERREYYRIEDSVALEIHLLTDEEAQDPSQVQSSSIMFDLLSELHISEFESQHLLRQLDERDRVMNSFLKALSKRIDLLSKVMAQTIMGHIGAPQPVIISEGGLQFRSPVLLPVDGLLSLKMVLMPQASGLMVLAKVIRCSRRTDGGFDVGTDFIDLPDTQRQLLARHILQRQAQARREALEKEKPQPD